MTKPAASAKAPVYFILVTVVLDAMGIGLILPVMPDLLMEVGASDVAKAALWGGVLSAVYAVMQFLFSPTIGSLSDRFGRRPVLLISTAVLCLDYVIMALAGTLGWLLIGRIIGGIAAATHATAIAYMADISAPEKKSANFGLISACFGIGFILGPVLGGLLAELGPRAPFVAAAILAGANFLYGLLILPETVTDRTRRPFQIKRANPFGALKYVTAIPGVGILLACYFFYQIANMVYPAVWAYYTSAAFDWGPRMVGISLACYGISSAIDMPRMVGISLACYGISMALVQGGLIRVIIARLGEMRTVYVFLWYNAVMLSVITFIGSGWLLLALTPLSALGAVVAPALQSVMSQRAADNQQGELQGVMSSINAIGMIVAPLVFTQVFWQFTAPTTPVFLPGAPFMAAAVLMAVAGAIYAMGLRVSGPAGAR